MGSPIMKKAKVLQSLTIFLLIAVISIFLTSCASPRAIRIEFDPYEVNQGGKYQIYIATEDTPWKQEVVSQLALDLGPDYNLKIENLSSLNDIQTGEWDVILVLSTFYAFGLQSDTEAFLSELLEKDKTILVVTSAISDLSDYGIDSITAASIGNTKEDAKSLTPKREPSAVSDEILLLIKNKTQSF